jgi:hypothetical protein
LPNRAVQRSKGLAGTWVEKRIRTVTERSVEMLSLWHRLMIPFTVKAVL